MSAEHHRCIAEQTYPLCTVSVVHCMSPVRSPYILWTDPDDYRKNCGGEKKGILRAGRADLKKPIIYIMSANFPKTT
jgi:hypothetical protein